MIEEHIQEMLKNKIIIPIQSNFASPVVLFKKKTELPPENYTAWRFTVDYRKLNKMTNFPSYPLPLIEEIIRKIKSAKYMSTLDLTSGYFQIPMRPADVNKTAFITKKGVYAFLRLPFGLCGAPSTFQRTMDKILRSILGEHTFTYLDGIIVTSETLEEHIKNLR